MKRIIIIFVCLLISVGAYAQAQTFNVRVHDPVLIKQGDTYYLFHTGRGVSVKTSKDRVNWENGGRVFDQEALPQWHKDDIPEQNGSLWAPDIHYRDGKYHLYYSVSAWMDFNSSIGYATNVTLDPNDPDYKWVDEGKVIDFRNGGEGVNCIDPNIFVDDDGKVWLLYGSYQAGLRMVELDPKTGKLFNEQPELIVLTTSLGEGVYLIKTGGYYYIFASRGRCCAGIESTYQVVMGRSKDIKGPYLNKKGESWVDNNYSLFMEGDYAQPGKGHNGFFNENDTTFIVYHAYTRAAEGTSLLSIMPMRMDEEGWPATDITKSILFAPIYPLTNKSAITPKPASKPLFRDPVYDGAADPVVIWNEKENRWFMFYTNRRANLRQVNGVDWVHGTPIGIAESTDGGATWQYRCNANIHYGDKNYTYWAPDVIYHRGTYHMYLTVVPGTFSDWDHPREIVHFISNNLIDWQMITELELASDRVIDAGVIRAKDGWWYMYYNNERDGKSIYVARSEDLYNWDDLGKVIDDQSGEGPKVFYWQDRYFMIVDNWDGLGVYSSFDLIQWNRQSENILQTPGKGEDDMTKGLHADVVINDGKAYIFYFTHPGRVDREGSRTSRDPFEMRRSSIQVAELEFVEGKIVCNRDKELYINLKNENI